MTEKFSCDGCGTDVTTGSRITIKSEGFEWGANAAEHFCSAACVIGRYHAAAGVDNLLKQYRSIKIATAPTTPSHKPGAGKEG